MRGKQGMVWSQDCGSAYEVGLYKISCYPSPQPSQKGLGLILLIIDTDGGVEGITI